MGILGYSFGAAFIAFLLHMMLTFDVIYIENNNLHLSKLLILQETEKCVKVSLDGETEIGPEDPVRLQESVFVVGTGDVRSIPELGHQKARNGSLFLLDFRESLDDPSVMKIDSGFPKSRPFHSQGMYFSKETRRLYVINHTGKKVSNSVVEVFNVDDDLKIQYMGSIDGGFGNFAINDVIELSESEILLTVFGWKDFPNDGAFEMTISEGIALIPPIFRMMMASETIGGTGFVYCSFKDGLEKKARCEDASEMNFAMANGISVQKKIDENIIYVADTILKRINVYRSPKKLDDSKRIKDQIIFERKISVADAPDNVEFDVQRNVLTVGAIPSLKSLISKKIPGSMLEINLETNESKRIMFHGGSKVSAFSSCLYINDVDDHHVVCGSPSDTGLLHCEI